MESSVNICCTVLYVIQNLFGFNLVPHFLSSYTESINDNCNHCFIEVTFPLIVLFLIKSLLFFHTVSF